MELESGAQVVDVRAELLWGFGANQSPGRHQRPEASGEQQVLILKENGIFVY